MKHKFDKHNYTVTRHFISIRIVLVFLAFFSVTSGFSVLAQDTKMNLKIKNQTLAEVLNQLEVKTGYSFLVRSNDVNLKEIITIDIVSKSLEEN